MVDMRINDLEWCQMEVAIGGKTQPFKDCKIWPGGACEGRWEETVASYTNFPTLRLDIDVNIAAHEDIEKARQVLLELVENDPDYLKAPAPRVVVTALNDYNIAFELQVWLDDERQHVEKRFELREKVHRALNRAGVEKPFETIQLAPIRVNMPG